MFRPFAPNSAGEQPALINQIRLTALLLIVLIIGNGLYAYFKGRQTTNAMINATLEERLNIAQSVLRYNLHELNIIGAIVLEQEQRFINYLDLDKLRPIQVMLQTIASKHDFDMAFLLDEDQHLLITNYSDEITQPSNYYQLVADLPDQAKIATLPAAFFREVLAHRPEQASPAEQLSCLKLVVPMYHDLGDIYGYVVLVKFIDHNKALADRLSESIESPFVIYNLANQAILSNSFNFPVPFPTESSAEINDRTYYTKTSILAGITDQPVIKVAVMVDKELFGWQQRQHLLNNMLPLAALICLTIFLNYMMDQLKKSYSKLISARREAEEASVAKGDFLANMSHEIRTPLNAVVGLTGLALKTELTAKQHDYLSKIESSTTVLTDIINDILDFSKIEAGKLELEKVNFDLNDVLTSLKNVASVKAEEKGIELIFTMDPNIPATLCGDSTRLFQVLLNLTDNGIKFTEQGQVRINGVLEDHDRESGQYQLRFTIEDTGIGLKPEKLSILFQSFTQADTSTTRRFGGTGLGLAICKHLVEMMGGEILVSSKPGNGSTFTFTVQLGCQEEAQPAQIAPYPLLARRGNEHPDPTAIRGAHILLVEDNEINQQVARELLENVGLRVTVAANGKEGVAALLHHSQEEHDFAAVLMDIQMPKMDGYSATLAIRSADSRYSNIPIIAMTAHASDIEKKKCQEVGMNDHLPKPISPELLQDTLVRWIAPMAGREEGEKKADQNQPASDGHLDDTYFPRELAGFDLSAGLHHFDGNKRLYLELLFRLHDNYGNVDKTIDHHLAQGELDQARELAHKIKGTVASFGALHLQGLASQLEQALRDNDQEKTNSSFASFSQILRETMTSIDDLRQSQPGAQEAPGEDEFDRKKAAELVTEIQAQINNDYGGALENTRILGKLLATTPLQGQVEHLHSHLVAMAADKALDCAGDIRQELQT
ncbi:MAG: ATP-binding protein [Thermodesulfobacteriota bacterium]